MSEHSHESSTTASVLPELTHEQLLQEAQFIAKHVHPPMEVQNDYEAYQRGVVDAWLSDARHSAKNNLPQQPMWMRRTFDSGSEFGAAVDYCFYKQNGQQVIFGMILIEEDSSVRAYVPDVTPELGPRLLVEYERDNHGIGRAVSDVEAYFATEIH